MATDLEAARSPEEWFAVFWGFYPKRQSKAGARRLFLKIVAGKHRDLNAGGRDICVGAWNFQRWCLAAEKEHRYIPLPTTWLHNGRWEDELPPLAAPTDRPARSARERSLTQDLNDRSWAEP